MLETLAFHESWIYNCTQCLAVWHVDYEVQTNNDAHGHESVIYFRDGQRCVSPWVDHVCPNCQGHSIKSRPAPWAAKSAVAPPPRRSNLDLVFKLRRLHAY